MRDEEKARDACRLLLEVCDTLTSFAARGQEHFTAEVQARWAVEMGLIRVGETVNRIPPSVLSRFPEQPWRQIIGMRNFAAHQYDDLDPGRVWRTLTTDVPGLRNYVADVILPALEAE